VVQDLVGLWLGNRLSERRGQRIESHTGQRYRYCQSNAFPSRPSGSSSMGRSRAVVEREPGHWVVFDIAASDAAFDLIVQPYPIG
jgi:hypothetical protein